MLLRNDSRRGEAAVPAATNRIPQATRMPLQDFAGDTHATTVPEMEHAIDSFIRFLAVERGLSENYQLSTQRSLSEFARWCAARKKIDNPRTVTLPLLSEYLIERNLAGRAAFLINWVEYDSLNF